LILRPAWPDRGALARRGGGPGGRPGGPIGGVLTLWGQNLAKSSYTVVYRGAGGPPQKRSGCAPCRGAQKGPNFWPLWVFLPLFCGLSHHVSPRVRSGPCGDIQPRLAPRRRSGERPQLGDGGPTLALGGPPGGVPGADPSSGPGIGSTQNHEGPGGVGGGGGGGGGGGPPGGGF
jgi:hypothetical protein